ncbi:hypothetical protein Q7P37_007902 [Cladosporium fusiforme]
MSVGVVLGKVVLDNPTKYHCGPNDPVTGCIALTYRPHGTTQTELARPLFGPLKLFVTFWGRAKTKIRKSNGQSSSTYRGRAPLFSQHVTIYDGPWTCEPRESTRFPFSLNFPAATQPMPNQGDFREDRRFHEEAGGPLPPTFATNFRGFSKSTEAFVEYRVSASMRMPGINVEIRGFEGEHQIPAILYEQPRAPMSQAITPRTQRFSQTAMLQNEYLLPEEERPSGFRQKTKFMFSSEKYPIYMYSVIITAPTDVYLGQPLVFEFSIRPNLETSTTSINPDLRIGQVSAKFTAYTVARCEHNFFTTPESDSDEALPRLPAEVLDQATPFGKSNDYTKVAHTRVGLTNTCSPFTTYNISRNYSFKLNFKISGAGKDEWFERRMPITVHPPLDDGSVMLSAPGLHTAHGLAQASSSSARPVSTSTAGSSTSPHMRELPKPPTPPKVDGLPQYDRPPEYDEVLDMTTEDDVSKDGGGGGKDKAVAS